MPYSRATLDVTFFADEDIITTSGCGGSPSFIDEQGREICID